MEIEKFNIKFVERTKEILESYKGAHEVSNLLNCTLGLIILPYEQIKEKQNSFWDTELLTISNLPSFGIHKFEPIQSIRKENIKYYPKTLKVFLQKIRNGLAHQNIQPVNENETFKGVIISNYFDKAKKHEDLKVEFGRDQLKEFALFIANEYLITPR